MAVLLDEYEIETSDELLIKRTLNRDGKGKIFINDQPVGARLLKEIGRYLVEIHGQFDNQGLLNPANHRDVLDAFGNYKNDGGRSQKNAGKPINRRKKPEKKPKKISPAPKAMKKTSATGLASWKN